MMRSVKAAVVCQNTVFADPLRNYEQMERFAAEAAREGAELIVFPEFCTTGFALSPALLPAIAASDEAEARLAAMSRRFQIAVGGSYLHWDAERDNAYNTFGLFFPGGQRYFHSKDIPTGLECFCYAPGDCASVFETPLGRIGAVLCWEQLRWDTVRRMAGQVDLLVGGSCWWNFAPEDGDASALASVNRLLAERAPSQLASLLGVPFVHASHCADFSGGALMDPERLCTRHIEGAAVIVDGRGAVQVTAPRPGYAVGTIDLDRGAPAEIPEGTYWIPALPPELERGFQLLNARYGAYYETAARPLLRRMAEERRTGSREKTND